MRASFPVQRIDTCIRFLEKLNLQYHTQKKNQLKTTRGYKDQNALFQSSLVEVLDIGAFSIVKNQEDRPEAAARRLLLQYTWKEYGPNEERRPKPER